MESNDDSTNSEPVSRPETRPEPVRSADEKLMIDYDAVLVNNIQTIFLQNLSVK